MTSITLKAYLWDYMTILKGEDKDFRLGILAALDATAPRPESEIMLVPINTPEEVGWRIELMDRDGVYLEIFVPQSAHKDVRFEWKKQ
jgi:hypothetical protein